MAVRARTRFTVPVLLAGQFLANVDAAVANLALPSIRTTLHASAAELQLVVAGYLVPYAALRVAGARGGALYGERRFFLGGVACFVVASLCCGLAPSPALLIAFRFAQGAGAAFLVSQVLTGVQNAARGEGRARALAWYTATLSGSAVVGQVLGGIIVSANLFGAGWRPVFLLNVPLGIALVAVAFTALPADAPRGSGTLDARGAGLLFAALALVLTACTLGRESGWPAWATIAVVAGLASGVAFVRRQVRLCRADASPLIDVAHLATPRIAGGLAALAASTATYFSMLFVVALYLQEGLHESARTAGGTLVAWVAAYGCAGPALARLRDRTRTARVATAGYALMAVAFAGSSAWAAAGRGAGPVFALLLACGGFGFGLAATAVRVRLTAGATGRHAADLSGALTTTSQVAAAAGVATFGSVYLALAPRGASPAFAVVTALFATSCAAALIAAAATAPAER